MQTDWFTTLPDIFQRLGSEFLKFIVAIVIFVIGWFIAVWIGRLVTEILKRIKFNQIFEKGNWDEALAKADIKVDASGFIGAIFKWVLVIVVLLVAVDFLGPSFDKFADLLKDILNYLPNVIVAALIFVAAVIIADIVDKVVRVSLEKAGFAYAHLGSLIIKWAVWVFAVLAILQQLKFDAADWIFDLIKIFFIGIVAMGAIAFGLGGKEVAAEFLQDLKKKLKG